MRRRHSRFFITYIFKEINKMNMKKKQQQPNERFFITYILTIIAL